MSSEYGWTDETIGELPLVRFRQITAAIQTRRFTLRREENARFSWLGRNLAGYIAAGFQMAEGAENTALAQAATLAMDDIEAALLKTAAAAPVEQKENSIGSYEKFMHGVAGSGGKRG